MAYYKKIHPCYSDHDSFESVKDKQKLYLRMLEKLNI